ncbi:MAG: family 43 glycosylhydrolase [Lachnospiraceae bacterium]|nr:family 43 glycosylhydrolase [Lachnospiraceae bacterium]
MDLQKAIEEQKLEAVKRILLEDPQRIDEVTPAGCARPGIPIAFYAAEVSSFEIVRYLVEYSRLSLNQRDEVQNTILHYATKSGDLERCRYLVDRCGMEIREPNLDLVTPFEIAEAQARKGAPEILAFYEERTGIRAGAYYKNPIRTGMFPDPSIVRVGEDYYMVNSSFVFFPCIPVSHSKDLVHWEIIGHAITDPAWAGLDRLEGGRGYWAPDISYDDGMFYITATYRLNDHVPNAADPVLADGAEYGTSDAQKIVYRRQIVVRSAKPEGPYSEPVFIEEDGIDPSLFHEDGHHYMLLNRGARILELNEDCTKQITPARLLYYGDQKRAPEGPHLLKKDGYYYLFLAEGGTGPGHRISVARSRELMGIYEPCPYNPILRQTDPDARIQRCGHGKPVQTPEGDWYMVYLCGRQLEGKYSMLGRETALDRITWTADGWPLVNGGRGPSAIAPLPKACAQERADAKADAKAEAQADETSRHGTAPATDRRTGWDPLVFMTPRPPQEGAVRVEQGRLILRSGPAPLESVDARNIYVRRQTAFDFTASVSLSAPPEREGQEAGLVCYYDENTWIACAVRIEGDGPVLSLREHIGTETRVVGEKVPLTAVFGGSRFGAASSGDHFSGQSAEAGAALRFQVVTRGLVRRFSVTDEAGSTLLDITAENVYYLCDEGIRMGKRFTGAMVGVYCVGGPEPFTCTFTDFAYAEDGNGKICSMEQELL